MKKVGISLPDEQLKAVDQIRKKQRIPRSRLIQRLIDKYLSQLEEERLDRIYEEGYRRIPEDPTEAEGYAKAAAEVLGHEDWS